MMRTRLIRPGFWADEIMARLPVSVRLTFMGLWGLADDAGYFEWRPREMAGELYRFEPVGRRERHLREAVDRLVAEGRVVLLDCELHGLVPTMERHRIQSGRHTFGTRDEHLSTCASLRGIPRPAASRSYRGRNATDSDSESSPPPPAERGHRANGTSPRQLGTSPRQTSTSARDRGTSPRQALAAEKRAGFETLQTLEERVAAYRAGRVEEPVG